MLDELCSMIDTDLSVEKLEKQNKLFEMIVKELFMNKKVVKNTLQVSTIIILNRI